MNRHKQLWMLVGGNGAGKSTFYKKYLEPRGLPFVNADILAGKLFPDDPEANSYEAAKFAEKMREQLILEGTNFCFESEFSHPSKIDFIARAKALGYQIVLVVIHLYNVSLNQARVCQRVAEGGHSVPQEKVATRIPRTLHNIRKALVLCDQVRLLDNSRLDDPFSQVATLNNNRLGQHLTPLPGWASQLLVDYL